MAPSLKPRVTFFFMEVTVLILRTAVHWDVSLCKVYRLKGCMDCVALIFSATKQKSPNDLDSKLQETGSNRF